MYKSLEECVLDLEKNGHLIRIKEEVNPYLEMAAIHLLTYERNGPAILFENIKGSKYRAVSNLFGNIERSKFIFRDTWNEVKTIVGLRGNPMAALKKPFKYLGSGISAVKGLPIKKGFPSNEFQEIKIEDLPMIHHWPDDGGAFITLPQVYTEDIDKPGIMNANIGMYRVQLNGNDYILNKEVGMHYQLHRGIGIHQTKANEQGKPLNVSIFIGGHPAHSLAAVMPLPEGLSEALFAGLLAGRRFRYSYHEGHCISNDADFVITGKLYPHENKPEGPFGDHLGYYSLTHPFPLMRVDKVYAKKNAIWSFTVVGRPPQEDTAFGNLIHELTDGAINQEVPGIKEVHAVDAAGVHPLLLAIGSERYTPYLKNSKPAEIITQANRILGTNQLSLAKYLWITAEQEKPLSTNEIAAFMQYILERIDWKRDIHFHTNTTIDTLDYSAGELNFGSKVVFAAYGNAIRTLAQSIPSGFDNMPYLDKPVMIMPGVIAIKSNPFKTYPTTAVEMEALSNLLLANLNQEELKAIAIIIVTDEPEYMGETLNNFLWMTFTKSNPSHDIYGVDSFTDHKHWGCHGPLIIDARNKPHHAPPLIFKEEVLNTARKILSNYGI